MPWHIESDNSECSGYAVVKDDDGFVQGCHDTKADAEAQMSALYANERKQGIAGIWERIVAAFRPIEQRAISMDMMGESLYRAGLEMGDEDEYGWYEPYYLTRIMVDEGAIFAIYNHRGKLYRSEVSIIGPDVVVGEVIEVVEEYTPIARAMIRREQDGVRLYMVAGAAAINRDGEIDSRSLFDNFVRYAEETGQYPKIDWYHLGRELSLCDIGQCDFVARGTNTYIASGLLDMSNPIARQVVSNMEAGEVYGCSIEYYPVLDDDSIETIYIGEIPITVYRDGINTRVTLLPEQRASHILTLATTSERKDRMTAEQAMRLRSLFENDDEFTEFVDKVGLNERALADAVTREAGSESEQDDEADRSAEDAAEDADVDNSDGDDAGEVVLDDALVDAIAERAASIIQERSSGPSLQDVVNGIDALAQGMDERFSAFEQRLADVEKDRAQDEEQWSSDLSRRVIAGQNTTFTYRPSNEQPTVTREQAAEAQGTGGVDVDSVLEKLPKLFS